MPEYFPMLLPDEDFVFHATAFAKLLVSDQELAASYNASITALKDMTCQGQGVNPALIGEIGDMRSVFLDGKFLE